MKYYREEGILDIADCEFENEEEMERAIKGSIASKIGFKTLHLNEETKTKHAIGERYKGKDTKVVESRIKKRKKESPQT